MRFSNAVYLAGFLALSSGTAWGALPIGDEVTVNPLPGGSGTLLYPGGQYSRTVQPLLQPGERTRDSGPILLHMPVKRGARAAAPEATAPRRTAEAPAPKPAPVAPPRPAPARRTAAAAPAPRSAYVPNYAFGAPQGSAAGLSIVAPPSAVAEPPAKQVAKAEPPASGRPLMTQEPPTPGLIKRSVILFSAGASDPAAKALDSIKFLAGDLNASMVSASSRIQLLAYGGEKGDKSSDARRLSLKRALSIRQVLIDDGVPSERIDVRAMGGADDDLPADRVDVFVKA